MSVDLTAEHFVSDVQRVGAGMRMGDLFALAKTYAAMEPAEIPMVPITMLRNALGVEEGGSGVPIDREAYRRSVEFWSRHANWR